MQRERKHIDSAPESINNRWWIIFWDYNISERWRKSLNVWSGSRDSHRNKRIKWCQVKCSNLTSFLVSDLLSWLWTEERWGLAFGAGRPYAQKPSWKPLFPGVLLLYSSLEQKGYLSWIQSRKQEILTVGKTMVKRFMSQLTVFPVTLGEVWRSNPLIKCRAILKIKEINWKICLEKKGKEERERKKRERQREKALFPHQPEIKRGICCVLDLLLSWRTELIMA